MMDNYDYDQIETREMSESTKNILAGIVIGGLIGATAMLLLAPRSGEEMRAELKDKASTLRDRTSETMKETVSQVVSKAGQLKGKTQDLRERGQGVLMEQLDRVSEAVEAARRVLQDI